MRVWAMMLRSTSRSSFAYIVPFTLMSLFTVTLLKVALEATKLPVMAKMPLTSRRPLIASVPS